MFAYEQGFPSGPGVKKPPANLGEAGLIPVSEIPLEDEMATHSNILAWKIPWTEEPCGLQSMGSQRVRHMTEQLNTTHTHAYELSMKVNAFLKQHSIGNEFL